VTVALPAPRTALVVPAVAGRRLDRAPQRGADQVVVDLEDAVPEEGKSRARRDAAEALSYPGWAGVRVAVRVNAWETAHTFRDVEHILAEARGRVELLVLPKVDDAAQVVALDLLVTQVERELGALVESAAGLLAAREIATASPRLSMLVLGPLDLAADLGADQDDAELLPTGWREDALRRLVLAGRAAGVGVLDGPTFGLEDPDAVRRAAARARAAGCDGCWVVHPAQIGPTHAAFTPTTEQVDRARSVLSALEGGAVGRHAGGMIDTASGRAARAVLARAGLIWSSPRGPIP
jgi:citrate lyase subunit beta/citryl-CoA lyase